MTIHRIKHGENTIEFTVKRKNVKNVNLNIKPDMTVEVSANENVPIDFICDFVKKKRTWILKHIKQFEDVQPEKQSKREYVSGESYKYLGKQYRLKVQRAEDKERVKYYRGFIYLYVKDASNFKNKEKLLEEWYREKARITFQQSLDRMYPAVQKYGIEKPTIQIKLMKARWGSALLDPHAILLNLNLIKAPKHCIDYVVLHELIHFKYNDHGDSFYNMLYSLMPDWEKRKAILDEEIVRDL
ncbi:M48 family metallopeptidase [Jeotgalibacillus sp. JSM ZJ347]|uniref:M48 family metallopeptidase n=1 Tax=Jeotgalibacillus sp. JSM ZJ347 TaxID=3342117 RepID=UPI0035A8FD19